MSTRALGINQVLSVQSADDAMQSGGAKFFGFTEDRVGLQDYQGNDSLISVR